VTTAVSFVVLGSAAPKGSMSAFAFRRGDGSLGAVVTDKTKGSREWQLAVRYAARAQCRGVYFDGAVRLAVAFYLPRPKSLPKKVTQHTKKPGLDKLVRAVKDALKGIVWKDDSQVVEVFARKYYAPAQPQAHIEITNDEGKE